MGCVSKDSEDVPDGAEKTEVSGVRRGPGDSLYSCWCAELELELGADVTMDSCAESMPRFRVAGVSSGVEESIEAGASRIDKLGTCPPRTGLVKAPSTIAVEPIEARQTAKRTVELEARYIPSPRGSCSTRDRLRIMKQ